MEEDISDECATKLAEEKVETDGLPFWITPIITATEDGLVIEAQVKRSFTYYYRNALKKKGYQWVDGNWIKKAGFVKWGDRINITEVDGMKWNTDPQFVARKSLNGKTLLCLKLREIKDKVSKTLDW